MNKSEDTSEADLGQGLPTPALLTEPSGTGRRLESLTKLNVSPEAVRALPSDFAKRHRVLPFEIRNGIIHIATSDPGNQRVIEDIRLLSGLEVQETEAPAAEILEKIAECYQVTVEQMIENLDPERGANVESKNLHDIEVMANEPTVVNLVNLIISTALRERASDIHLVPFEETLQLRYRIDGLLQEKPPPPKQLHAALVSRIKIMADMNIAERFIPQDGHIQIHHRGARVDIRVGTMPTIYGESLVMRLLEKNTRVLTAQELGLDPERSALLIEPEFLRGQHPRVFLQQPHDQTLSVNGGHGAHANVHAGASMVDLDMAVLWYEPLGDIHVGHDLDAGNQRGVKLFGRWRLFLQKTVNPVPQLERRFERDQMN